MVTQRRARSGGGQRRVTQADVARHAGVSNAVVSTVINGRIDGRIGASASTRERVWQSVRDLGYVPNIAARNLARGRNGLIGVFTYRPVFPLESRDFYHEFLIGIEEEAERSNLHMMLFTGSRDSGRRRSIYAGGVNALQLADGSVLLGTGESTEELAQLAADGYPFVFIGHREIPGVALSYVAADYVNGTGDIVRQLHARGHRRIAFIQSAGIPETNPGRRAGFRQARDELGISPGRAPVLLLGPRSAVAEQDCDASARTVAEVLEWALRSGISALVVERSAVAVELRSVAERSGVGVPDTLALVGLSGAPEEPGTETLAELHVPRREMGQEAVRLLLRIIDEPAAVPMHVTLPCGLRKGLTLGDRA